jgi:hypothetical protein
MTRKDYIIIAEALRVSRKMVATDEMVRGIDDAVESLTINLKTDNPRFDKPHFVAVVRGEKDLRSRPKGNR